MSVHLGFWDALLLVVVSVQATVLAYLHHPRWKALVLTLPIPFTVATMAVGLPIDATNVCGLLLLLMFTHGVRILHQNLRAPVVPSIAAAAMGYCLLGWMLAGLLPVGDAAFWTACVATVLVAVTLLKTTAHREEPGHRSSLPVWIKLPIIMLVIGGLLLIKHGLRGFTTVFPMVTVVGLYEARHSLWTMSRQVPVIILGMVPMMIVCRLAQERMPQGAALALSWVLFLAALGLLHLRLWHRNEITIETDA
ncbi:MAG: hypothetical protein HY360_11490 [Verrucomicrobia bacterium]|nr:hypothetical protein [Verrucomicrobiota bacterium]